MYRIRWSSIVINSFLFLISFQTIFLPVVGLVDPDKLKPGDLVGVNKDSYLILDTLPSEYDSRVKAMEVDEKPTEDYNDIGGLEKQVILLSWRSMSFFLFSFIFLMFLMKFNHQNCWLVFYSSNLIFVILDSIDMLELLESSLRLLSTKKCLLLFPFCFFHSMLLFYFCRSKN